MSPFWSSVGDGWRKRHACLPTSPSPEGDLVVAPHYLFIKQGDEGSKGFLRFFSYPRSAFTSYWDVCFHFKVNFWNFFLLWSGPEGFVISFRKGKAKPKTFPLRSSHYFQLFQVPWMSPGNVTPSLWGGLVALGWDLFFFPPLSFFSFLFGVLKAWLSSVWCIARVYCLVLGDFCQKEWNLFLPDLRGTLSDWLFLRVLHVSSGCSICVLGLPSSFVSPLAFCCFSSSVLQHCKSSEILSLCLLNNVTMETNDVSWGNLMSRYLNLFNWRNLLIL